MHIVKLPFLFKNTKSCSSSDAYHFISADDRFCLIILSAFKSRFLVSSPSELVAPLLFESSLCSGSEIIFDYN